MNMKIVALACMATLLCGMSGYALAQDKPASGTSSAEEPAVRVPLDRYLKAHATGDGALIHKAFHPTAKIMSVRDGTLNALSVEAFAARFNGRPAADEAQRKRRIDSIDITGNAAVATIVLDYPAITFTDHMSLLKIDGEWKIVNKSFHGEPKPGP